MGQMTIKYANPLGDYDQKYGQRYYGKAHDVAMDISFNLMNPVNFEDGDTIEFEERVIKQKGPQSKNPGEDYLFLKKVKRADSGGGGAEPSSTPPQPSLKEPRQATTSPKMAAAAPDYEAGTNARWALKLSVDTYKAVVGGMPDSQKDFDNILQFARWLVAAFSELKNADDQPKPEAEEAKEDTEETVAPLADGEEITIDDIPF